METLPFGSWPTPVTSELVVRSARTANGVAVDGDDVWWSESIPEEGGRTGVRRRRPDGTVDDVLVAPGNARTAVHEYGGGAWWARDGILWYADWASQRLHRLEPGAEPVALTPEPDRPRGLRYADGDISPDGSTILCVQEAHQGVDAERIRSTGNGFPPGRRIEEAAGCERHGDEVTNTVVRIAAHQPSTPEVVVEGPDFVSDPRWRPDGAAFCWLEWDHPDMPWDAVRLVVDQDGARTVVAGGDRRESICQPTWAADGSLWFSGDRSGFWNLYRWTPAGAVEPMVVTDRDIGFPAWVFGQRCYALLEDGRVAVVVREDGFDRLAVAAPGGAVEPLDLPYSALDGLLSRGASVLFVGATPTAEPHVVAVDVAGGTPVATAVVAPRALGVDRDWWSTPEPISFPTAGGAATAHGHLYRPRNPGFEGPPGDRPPLLVMIHGGPTSSARPFLRLALQYWTTRGFAVVDVDYRGSTGYGRAYRDQLRGQWGVADVEDCAAAATWLVEQGEVDPARLCIRGGSAGGFTTLAALATQRVFAAGASHYGVADLRMLATDTHKFESRYLDGLVGPWPASKATYDERSPICHTDRIDRPLIVFQGLEDEVVPPNQADLIVEAVRSKGVPVAYLSFEGEQHGFRRAENIRAALDGELSFYGQVLRFELPPPEGIVPVEVENLGTGGSS